MAPSAMLLVKTSSTFLFYYPQMTPIFFIRLDPRHRVLLQYVMAQKTDAFMTLWKESRKWSSLGTQTLSGSW